MSKILRSTPTVLDFLPNFKNQTTRDILEKVVECVGGVDKCRITGSNAYGLTRAHSDVDLVAYIPEGVGNETIAKLFNLGFKSIPGSIFRIPGHFYLTDVMRHVTGIDIIIRNDWYKFLGHVYTDQIVRTYKSWWSLVPKDTRALIFETLFEREGITATLQERREELRVAEREARSFGAGDREIEG